MEATDLDLKPGDTVRTFTREVSLGLSLYQVELIAKNKPGKMKVEDYDEFLVRIRQADVPGSWRCEEPLREKGSSDLFFSIPDKFISETWVYEPPVEILNIQGL